MPLAACACAASSPSPLTPFAWLTGADDAAGAGGGNVAYSGSGVSSYEPSLPCRRRGGVRARAPVAPLAINGPDDSLLGLIARRSGT